MIHKAFKHSLLFLSLAVFAAIVISGCSSSSTPPPTNTNVTPKTGSTYTYQKHEVDSSKAQGRTTPPDSTIVATVVSSGTTFEGKSNVVTVYDDFDTLRFVVETNGDVSVYRASFGSNGFVFTNPSPWLTLPYGSKKTGILLFVPKDTLFTYGGTQEHLLLSATADYIGTDEVDTGTSHTKLAYGGKAKITITITGTSPATVNISSTQTYSFDLSIGNYFHSISNTIFHDVTAGPITLLPGNTTFSEKILTQFNLIK